MPIFHNPANTAQVSTDPLFIHVLWERQCTSSTLSAFGSVVAVSTYAYGICGHHITLLKTKNLLSIVMGTKTKYPFLLLQ